MVLSYGWEIVKSEPESLKQSKYNAEEVATDEESGHIECGCSIHSYGKRLQEPGITLFYDSREDLAVGSVEEPKQ
jgi:hypothetical protein